jgi:hypothetical protein
MHNTGYLCTFPKYPSTHRGKIMANAIWRNKYEKEEEEKEEEKKGESTKEQEEKSGKIKGRI